MATSALYFQEVSRIYPDHLPFAQEISRMHLKGRSALIKCCQAQHVPSTFEQSTLLSIVESAPNYASTLYGMRRVLSCAHEFKPLFVSPVLSAITLDIIRGCPLDSVWVQEAMFAGWNKEIVCCETVAKPAHVVWEVFFDPDRWATESVVPGIPPNVTMCQSLYAGLHRLRSKMHSRRLFPRMTHKNMSRATRRCFEQETGLSLEYQPIFGQDDWFRFYDRTGIKLGGECEMRMKWYPSGHKPRCYYAQGGTTYQASCYLQDFFTDLVNSSPITHHVSRLRHGRLTIPTPNHLLIYDLTSFTSRMDEQRYFMRSLANFMAGVLVEVVDPREGIVLRDFGDMLHEYCDSCVENPAVSYERFPDFDLELISEHARASMLGIFGNLMSCTFAHGVIVAQTVHDEDQLNVAGDDGATAEDSDPFYTDLAIRAVGDYEREKTFRGDEAGAIALKRPIHMEGEKPVLGVNVVPINLILYLYQLFAYTDPRYSFIPELLSESERINIIGKDMMRYLRSLHRNISRIGDEDLTYAFNAYQAVSRRVGRPVTGALPNVSLTRDFWPCWENIEDITEDPLEVLCMRHYRGYAFLPVFSSDEPNLLRDGDVGESWVDSSSRGLGFLEKLGYIERVAELKRDVSGYQGFRELVDYLKFEELRPRLYRYEILRRIPPHLSFILFDE